MFAYVLWLYYPWVTHGTRLEPVFVMFAAKPRDLLVSFTVELITLLVVALILNGYL
jgi:hypothetical protein